MEDTAALPRLSIPSVGSSNTMSFPLDAIARARASRRRIQTASLRPLSVISVLNPFGASSRKVRKSEASII